MTKKLTISKKLLSVIIGVIMLTSMLCMDVPTVKAQAATDSVDSEFSIVQGTVTAYIGNAVNIKIPDGVTAIQSNVFANKTNIRTVNLNGVTALGEGVFRGCTALNSVTGVGALTTIPANTFKDCMSLSAVAIPSSVTSIGDYAFSGCKTLANVDLPSALKTLSATAFENCTGLQRFTITANSTYTAYDGCLYTNNTTTLSKVPAGKTTISFANTANTIATGAFDSCAYLASVTIPDSVYQIQADAFKNSGVVFMTIPRTTVSIGNQTDHKIMTVSGYTGSAAQTFAATHNISFLAIDAANTVKVTDVTLDKTALAVDVNGTATLTATVAPANATNKAVTWKSSDEKIATVSNTGIVKGIANGNAVITATTMDGSKTATCNVTVGTGGIESITLDKTAMTLRVGGTAQQLSATILPATAASQALTWTSSNTNVATVSSTGLVTPVSVGTAIITVASPDKSKTATCSVTVSNEKATGITICAKDVSVNRGGSIILSATLKPSTAQENITWTSDNPKITKIIAKGDTVVIEGVSEGETYVYAKCESGYSASCLVRVESPYRALIAKVEGTTGQVKKAVMSGRTLKVTVKKVSISGVKIKYQIRYKEKVASTWKSITTSKTTKNIKGLVKGATYDVQVRPYATIDGKIYCGKWSE